MTLHIGDGIEFVKRCAANEKKRGQVNSWIFVVNSYCCSMHVCACTIMNELLLCTHAHPKNSDVTLIATYMYTCAYLQTLCNS